MWPVAENEQRGKIKINTCAILKGVWSVNNPSTFTATPERVLSLLRRLTPRERLHVIAQVLPDLERELPAQRSDSDFWDGTSLAALAQKQNVQPVKDFNALLSGWPSEESVDDFITELRQWRQQDLVRESEI
jgi:hypothetical protein